MSVKYTFNPFTGNFDAVLASAPPPFIIGGTPNTFAGFDAGGALESIPGWGIDPNFGGAAVTLNITPTDGSPNTFWLENYSNAITPTNDLSNYTINGWNNTTSLVGPHNFNNGFVSLLNAVNTSGTGFKSGIVAQSNTLNLGDGTNVETSQDNYLLQMNTEVANNHTANSINGADVRLDIQAGGTTTNTLGLNLTQNLNGSVSGNIGGINVSLNVGHNQSAGINGVALNGAITNTIPFLNGMNVGFDLQSGAVVTSGSNAVYDTTHLDAGATLNSNWTSFGSYFQSDAAATMTGGFNGVIISPTLHASMAGSGYNGFFQNPAISSSMDFFNGFISFANLNTGANITNGIDSFSDQMHLQTGASANSITSFNAGPNFDAGSTVSDYKVLNASINALGTMNNVQFGNFSFGTGSTATQVSGFNIDLQNVTSPNQKTALSINDGSLAVNSNYDTSNLTPSGEFQMSYLGGQFHIASGFPITNGSFGFGNNMGLSIFAEDSMGPDATTLGLGFSVNGLVNQIAVTSGKTLDSVNFMLAGGGISPDSTGGTITDLSLFRAVGLLPEGGTLNVTNLYAFRAGGALSMASPTNLWGVSIEDSNAENFFQKSLAIATSSKKVSNASVALEIGGTTSTFRNAVVTTTQRNALTALEGMQVWNTTTHQLEEYNGSAWIASQPAGNYITALTGDVTAAGPGSAAATVAKIQGTTVSGTTGSNNVVFSTAPTLSNPVVGTQSQGDTSTKAASTAYVDIAISNAIAGVNPAVAVQAATTAASDTSGFTYNNGASGIGATLTGAVNTALIVDGYTFTALGQRLLVKNDTQSPSGAFNGIYYVTQVQTAILPLILTRALDYDQPSDINNTGAIPVINGTVNGTTSWVETALVVTVGTSPLVFAEFTRNPADYLLKANNLSDVASKPAAFDNLSPMTTGGDLIYGGASGTGTRLPNGTAGQVLSSSGGTAAPAWVTPDTTPSGSIIMYGAASAPSGWLLCDGSAVSRTTYAALFTAISTTFGVGDGSTTFNVPDMRGIFPRGAGTSSTLNNANGTPFAGTLGTYENDKFQGHKFQDNVAASGAGGTIALVQGSFSAITPSNDIVGPADNGNGPPRTGTETNPANLSLTYIIKQ